MGITVTDSAGKTLKQARIEASALVAPPGYIVVLGRWYPLGSLSSTFFWACRFQVGPAHDENLGGAGTFRAVERVQGAPIAPSAGFVAVL